MGSLLLILLVVGVTLAVVLAAGALFFQSYIYTEVSPGVLWQAPLAAAVMTAFFVFWSWIDIPRVPENVGYVPYDTLVRFSPELKLLKEPAKEFTSVNKGGGKLEYKGVKIPQGTGNTVTQYYLKGDKGKPWSPSNVEAIIIKKDDQEYRFEPRQAEDNDYPYFISPEGWRMNVYDRNVTGLPRMFSFGLMLVNVLLNLLHLALWFVCLWLILRFQWSHALGLAFVLWLVAMLTVVPMLLSMAAAVVPAA